MDHFNFRTCDQTSFTEKKSIAQSAKYIYIYIYTCKMEGGNASRLGKRMAQIAPPGAIKFSMVCYGRKRGTDDGFLGEVSSFLGEICSSLEIFSSSTYHCSSGNHYGLVAKLVFGKSIHYI